MKMKLAGWRSRLLRWPCTPKFAGSTPAQVCEVFVMQKKSTAAYQRSPDISGSVLYHHSLGAFLWRGNWASKLLVGIGIPP
ncbi:hypothetical protein TNCV_895091 [Trichonephila clavipes]|nr:hypothetical protein TNCV_895091 [Trichonephila clavipes]